MSLKKVVMEHQTTGVCRYVIKPGPHIKLAPRTHDATERSTGA